MTKPRRQVARCMVRFNALNSSRPRTESGEPVNYSEKKRCMTFYERKTSKNDLVRTLSDPDLYRSTMSLHVSEFNTKFRDRLEFCVILHSFVSYFFK